MVYMDILAWTEVANLRVVQKFPRKSFWGPLVLEIPVLGFEGGKSFSQKVAVATRLITISL